MSAGNRRKSGAAKPGEALARLLDDLQPWKDQHSRVYISVEHQGVASHLRVRSQAAQHWLIDQVMHLADSVPTTTQIREAKWVLEAKGRASSETHRVWTRSALHEGCLYIDLTDGTGRAVRVTQERWEIVKEVPVRFYRSEQARALPAPVRNPEGPQLRAFINVDDDGHYWLLCGALVAALWPEGPRYITVFQGRHGTGKSTLGRIFIFLTDPQADPVQTLPRGEKDLAIACTRQRVLLFDNVSDLRQRESDGLCRVSTGAAHSSRALYTDDEVSVIPAQASLVLTGVGAVLDRPDAIDRAITLELPTVPEEQREAEGDLWPRIKDARPHLFAVLLDGLQYALAGASEITGPLPRMADAARVAAAAMPAFGATPEAFLAAYARNESESYKAAIEASPIGDPLLDLVHEHGEWEGTHTDLLAALEERTVPRRRGKGWPGAANALSGELARLLPALEKQGITTEYRRSRDRASRKLITFTDEQRDPDREAVGPARDTVVRGVRAQGKTRPRKKGGGAPMVAEGVVGKARKLLRFGR